MSRRKDRNHGKILKKMDFTKTVNLDKQMKFTIIILIVFIKIQSQSISNSISDFPIDRHAISIYFINGNVLHCDSSVLKVHKNQIDSISLSGNYYHSSETDSIIIGNIKGIPYQNSWIFEKQKGNISLYSNLPIKNDNKISFISKKDTICPYSLLSLSKFVRNNPRSYSLVEKEMVADFIAYIPMAIGVSYGIYQIFHNNFNSSLGHMEHGLEISPIFFVVGVAFSLPCYLTRNNAEKAINNYNTMNFK